jgi:hypothetical protein
MFFPMMIIFLQNLLYSVFLNLDLFEFVQPKISIPLLLNTKILSSRFFNFSINFRSATMYNILSPLLYRVSRYIAIE